MRLDRETGAYFEIPAEPYLALDVYHHPLLLPRLQHRRLRGSPARRSRKELGHDAPSCVASWRAPSAPSRWTRCSTAATGERWRRTPSCAWESSEGLESWENAPAPALVAKRFLEGALGRDVPHPVRRFLNNATHWGFGLAPARGTDSSCARGSRRCGTGSRSAPRSGRADYVVLPQLGVYEQIWEYDLETLAKDLSAHLVFGTATAAAYSLLTAAETHCNGSVR